ncbi:MAG: hypothetical protein M9918_19495 [Anaerolineae bacterium]|nr:hypothetical protein [Anaerolineae bacterium]
MNARNQQRAIAAYDFICSYWRQHGIAPSRAEIAQAIGISKGHVVAGVIGHLAQAGLLEVMRDTPRGIRPKGMQVQFEQADAATCRAMLTRQSRKASVTRL